jgi:TrmH family RNA methyltransferase
MVSKNKAAFILSLQKRKIREEEKLFVAEGDKIVKEFLEAGMKITTLVAKPEFIASVDLKYRNNIDEIIPATFDELRRISTLKTPHNALALVKMKEGHAKSETESNSLSLALDSIQDPGNLGTIIRAAAWFGINDIFCSPDSVDIYNPKVIQSTMGALLHVNVYYTDLAILLGRTSCKIYGAVTNGLSIYSHQLSENGLIVLGNESRGISGQLLPLISELITIPRFGSNAPGIESLNVGMAASVILSEFRRRI